MTGLSPVWRARWFAIAIAATGLLATVLVAVSSATAERAAADDWLQERADVVGASTDQTVQSAIRALHALSGFIENSESVTHEEFSGFVTNLDERLWLLAVTYIAIVDGSELAEHEETVRLGEPDYYVHSFGSDGRPSPVDRTRDVYYPVDMLFRGPLLAQALPENDASNPLLGIGYDAASPAEWASSIEYALSGDTAAVSDFLLIEAGDRAFGKAFLVLVPVHDDAGTIVGLVGAPMVDFLLTAEADNSMTQGVTWEISTAGAFMPSSGDRPNLQQTIVLPGTEWVISVEPTDESLAALTGPPVWVDVVVGLALTGLVVYLYLLVTQRSRASSQLLEMESIAREKDRFLASVSHELRTPLTVVAGLSHELSERGDQFDISELNELLALIAHQSDEVSAIVEDLLVSARADISQVKLAPEEFDPLPEIERVLEATGLEFVVHGSSSVVWADPKRVRQIARNLVSNAARYGGPHKEIRFGASDDLVWIDVADSGPPIPADQQQSMFEPYVTTSDQRGSRVGAMGLGLFISQRLAALQGGELTYRHEGGFGVFRLSLPATRSAAESRLRSAA